MSHSPLSMAARNVFDVAPDAPGPVARAVRAAFAQGRALTPVQRRLLWFAAFTFATGLFHVAVWLALGMPSLVGPVTWRKPIVFGLSIGVLFASLTWITAFLPADRGMTRSSRALLALVTIELGLIDLQQWRGVPSHFNESTPFDYWAFQAMGLIIIVAAIIVGQWTWRLLRVDARDTAAAYDRPEQLHAARAAMVLLAAGNVIGLVLATTGTAQAQQTGVLPAPVGTYGDLKHAHAVALHALQVLPIASIVIGWFVRRRAAAAATDAASRRALSVMRLTTVAYVGLLLFTLTRTLTGDTLATFASMAIISPLASVLVAACAIAVVSGDSRPDSHADADANARTNAERPGPRRADPRAVRFVMALDDDLLTLDRGVATRDDGPDDVRDRRNHAAALTSTHAVHPEKVH